MAPEEPAGGVNEDDWDEERQSDGPDGGHFNIALHVTGYGNRPGPEHVDENSLAGMAKDAECVKILSAYYVPKVLETIAGACQGDVRIVLNGLGGQRLNAQTEELETLQTTLRERSQSAEIRLAFADGVFHTKLYVFGRGADAVAWIGSANVTKAGLNGRNEEVLVRVAPAPPSVLAYVESAWSRAMPLECCRQKVNSLIAFFRTGLLYYKPYATLQMTINPFRRLMETLPAAEKRKIAAFQSEFADDEAGIGAFNLNRAFNLDRGFERETEEESGELLVDRRRVGLRRHAVETCYGYWVAEPFITEVDAKLAKASADKRHHLEAICEWMEKDRDAIIRAYTSYLKDVRRMLDTERVEWRKHTAPDLFEETSAVEGRMDSLLAALSTERRLTRHCQAFAPGEVPEIWEDDAACVSFSGSFFDSLAYASSAGKRYGSSKLILDSLELSCVTAGEIREALKCALGEDGWYEANFG